MRDKIIREFIIEILKAQHSNELDGRGYDFYFVLRNKLDEINKKLIKTQ